MENVVTSGEGRDEKAKRQGPRRAGADGLFFTEVNGAIVKFSEPTPKGERVLDKAGWTPAGDYVLIQLLRHSSQSVGLDETVDLATEGTEVFRAFKSDRIFRFTLNRHGFEWGVGQDPGARTSRRRAMCRTTRSSSWNVKAMTWTSHRRMSSISAAPAPNTCGPKRSS